MGGVRWADKRKFLAELASRGDLHLHFRRIGAGTGWFVMMNDAGTICRRDPSRCLHIRFDPSSTRTDSTRGRNSSRT